MKSLSFCDSNFGSLKKKKKKAGWEGFSYLTFWIKQTIEAVWRLYMSAQLLKLCLTLCDPMDCSLPGSSVHGIIQARILERFAMPFSWGSSHPRQQTSITFISCVGRWVLYHSLPQMWTSILQMGSGREG